MPGTNFTENYELPLYAPDDIYSPMGTHNDAMDKIDNALVNVQEDAAQAIYLARQAASNFADIPQMQQQIKDNTDHIDIVERKLSTVTGTVMALVKSVDGYNDNFNQVNVDMETIRGQMDDINKAQASINKSIATNTGDIATLKGGVSSLSTEVNDINDTISDNEVTLNNLSIKVTQQGTNIFNVQLAQGQQKKDIDELQTDVAGLKADMPNVSLQDIADTTQRLDDTVYAEQTGLVDRVAELEMDISGDATAEPPTPGIADRVANLEEEQTTADTRLDAIEDSLPVKLNYSFDNIMVSQGIMYITDKMDTPVEIPDDGVVISDACNIMIPISVLDNVDKGIGIPQGVNVQADTTSLLSAVQKPNAIYPLGGTEYLVFTVMVATGAYSYKLYGSAVVQVIKIWT